MAHTSQTTSKNLFVAARQPSIERFRRRSREFSKRLSTAAVFRPEVLIAERRNPNLAVVLLILRPDVERMMNHTPLVRTEQGTIEVRQGFVFARTCAIIL